MPTLDLKLTGGLVIDGTGAPGRRADVGVRDDAIAAVVNGRLVVLDGEHTDALPGKILRRP